MTKGKAIGWDMWGWSPCRSQLGTQDANDRRPIISRRQEPSVGGEMRTAVGFTWLAVAAASALLAVPAVARPESGVTSCTGVLPPGTYQRVVVPAGATCFSDGPVTIRSGLFVEQGATF